MSDKLSMPLWDEQQGHAAFQTVWRAAKAHLSAGRRMLLTLAPETRSTAQNALHAVRAAGWANCRWKLDYLTATRV